VGTEKGHATMLFSREELEVIEACVLYCLDRNALDEDTAKDAALIIEEIRIALDKSPRQVADLLAEQIVRKMKLGQPGDPRPTD
jgi:hypothetical protein